MMRNGKLTTLQLKKEMISSLLLQLEEAGFFGKQYVFARDNNELKLLGEGGYSYVFEMYDRFDNQKRYAAKIMGLGTEALDEELFHSTVEIQRTLSGLSQCVMRIFDHWSMKVHVDERGTLFHVVEEWQSEYKADDGILVQIIIMEKLEPIIKKNMFWNASILREDLKEETGVIEFAKQIGSAVSVIHKNGYLHRDIKLENIFWDEVNQCYKLGDFGISRYIGDQEASTVVYTGGYGAPEIIQELLKSYNQTADIYSFGIMLYVLLNDMKFPASDRYTANKMQYYRDFIIPAPENASPKSASIIRKMCSYCPKDRYQSIDEALNELDGTCQHSNQTEFKFEEDEIETVYYEDEDDVETVYYDDEDDIETEYYDDEDDIETEYYDDDIETEYYEAEDYVEAELYEEADDGTMIYKQKEPESPKKKKVRKPKRKLSREEKMMAEMTRQQEYKYSCRNRLIFMAIVSVFVLKAFTPNPEYLTNWIFWLVPIVYLGNAILKGINVFRIEINVITLIITAFSIFQLGLDLFQALAILVFFMGTPATMAGYSIGMILWALQILTQKMQWLNAVGGWSGSWLLLILFYTVLLSTLIIRAWFLHKLESFILQLQSCIWGEIVICGIVFLVQEACGMIAIPDLIERMHLIWTGLGCGFVTSMYLSFYGIGEDDDDWDIGKLN